MITMQSFPREPLTEEELLHNLHRLIKDYHKYGLSDIANMVQKYLDMRDELIKNHKNKYARIGRDLSVNILSNIEEEESYTGVSFIFHIGCETDLSTQVYLLQQ